MSTLSEIYFNYNRAVRQAAQLEEISRDLKNAADNDLENILGDISRAWKSDSAPQYISKGQKVKTDIGTTAKTLKETARAIRIIADRIRIAELEAWRIANERNS